MTTDTERAQFVQKWGCLIPPKFHSDFESELAALSSQAGAREVVATVCLRGDTYAHGQFTELQVQHAEGIEFPIGTKFYTTPPPPDAASINSIAVDTKLIGDAALRDAFEAARAWIKDAGTQPGKRAIVDAFLSHLDSILAQPAQGGSNLPECDTSKPNTEQGLYRKYDVRRIDGSDAPGGKHYGCEYFVLDVAHDPHAKVALNAYQHSVAPTHPQLASDMRTQYGLQPAQGERLRYTECNADCDCVGYCKRGLEDRQPAQGGVFVNRGDSEAQFIADGERLNCPTCGGSGHVDDAQAGVVVPDQDDDGNFLREHGAELASLRKQLAGDGWLPIESAPHTGIAVLLWQPWKSGRDCTAIGHYANGWVDRNNEDMQPEPTHWRPLPQPPAIDQARGASA